MALNISFLLLQFFMGFTLAEVTAPTESVVSDSTSNNLPSCIDSQEDIDRISNHQRNNRRNDSKYLIYRQLLQGDSEAQLLARLAYAESLAANCPNQYDQVVPRITNVIGNRIRVRDGNVRSVVFQRDQFASSLNIYSSSRYKDFLCPKNKELWNRVLTAATEQLQSSSATSGEENDTSRRLSADSINYFLPNHDPRWPNPPEWGLKENMTSTSDSLRGCLRVFHVPHWK